LAIGLDLASHDPDQLLERALKDFHPWFLGAYGENHQVLEELVVEAMRDHLYWRRNFHPESQPPIPTSAQYQPEYQEFIALLKSEMYRLSADLKQSVPFFSPRYIGHMASDLLLPGVVARIATLLYNPNHVCEDVSPATIEKELIVGDQLANMLGYDLEGDVRAFGHMTSGGTVANYEGLRNLMAARLYPVAAGQAARDLDAEILWRGEALSHATPAALAHLSVGESVALRRTCILQAEQLGLSEWVHTVEACRYERLGLMDFLTKHPELGRPRILVPVSGHYSWSKAMKLLGLGTKQMVELEVDESMRMSIPSLKGALEDAKNVGDVVIAVVPILGTTEFGAIDPIDKVVEIREEERRRGFEFGIHLDAAWGGYLRSLFKNEDGTVRTRSAIQEEFKYFPSAPVYDAFRAVAQTDSATVDPHKLAFIPYSVGAYIAQNRNIVDFVQQDAAYVFEPSADDDARFKNLGQFILEGSKAGAVVASAYVTHRVIPLHVGGFGKIIAHSIRSCELFYDKARDWADKMKDRVVLGMPTEPDTNIACFALNPAGNRDVATANLFTQKVLLGLSVAKDVPVQDRQFIVSSTKLFASQHGGRATDALLALGLDESTFGQPGGDFLLVLRHTLMNPWLLAENEVGKTYIDLYFEYLEELVLEALS